MLIIITSNQLVGRACIQLSGFHPLLGMPTRVHSVLATPKTIPSRP